MRRLAGFLWASTVTVRVAMTPGWASTILGAYRRSIRAKGRCQHKSTIWEPAIFSIKVAMRGPTPFKDVIGLNSEKRISGRMGSVGADKGEKTEYILERLILATTHI